MSAVTRVLDAIKPVKTVAEQAAADAQELDRHLERTKTERARRAATVIDLQRQLTELVPRRDRLRARRDPGLFAPMDDLALIEQDLAVLETREAELTAELVEAQAAVRRADLAIPDLEQRQKMAATTVVEEKRRANLIKHVATVDALLAWAEGGYEMWQRAQFEVTREETLASEATPPRADYTVRQPRFPAPGYLGQDPRQLVESLREYRKQLGQL